MKIRVIIPLALLIWLCVATVLEADNKDVNLHASGSYLLVDGAGREKAYIGADGYGNDVQFGSFNPEINNVALYNAGSAKLMSLYVRELHISGGADLAEPFQASDKKELKSGMLVTIDPSHPGNLSLSQKPYDRTVAGIVSGANGLNPGIAMTHNSGSLEGTVLVALTGRAYAWADASEGEIQPGDLLTTSNTPGHAMKVFDYARAQGAIIGKAMSSLEAGRGLVLILVNLQ